MTLMRLVYGFGVMADAMLPLPLRCLGVLAFGIVRGILSILMTAE